MASYVQLKCPHCSDYQLVDKDKRFEQYECRSCRKQVEPETMLKGVSAAILSDRIRQGQRLSAEFRDNVLNPIMSVKGAENANRKFG